MTTSAQSMVDSTHPALAGPFDGAASERPDRQVLNAPDVLMYVGHKALRGLGHAGFLCQSHAWLEKRVNLDDLSRSLEQLGRTHPVVTSRLVEPDDGRELFWHFRPDAVCRPVVTELPSDDPAEVDRYAERLMARPTDLDRMDPIEFHLVRRPNDGDVLIVQFCHALMDGKAPELVLRELNRLSGESTDEPESSGSESIEDIGIFLRRAGRLKRLRAAWRVVRSHMHLPVKPLNMVPPDAPAWVFEPIRIVTRSLDADQSRALTARVRALCGFANISPAVLAGIYRVISRMTPRRQGRGTVFATDVPLNLRPPNTFAPIFRNFMSFISMQARFDDLGNRDGLTVLLHRQMRDQLRRGIDLGNLQMMSIMSGWRKSLARHLQSRIQHHPLTLGYGFLGPLTPGLESILGVPVKRFYTLNLAMSPPGVTVQLNQACGETNLAMSYISSVVPDDQAACFLDSVIRDVLA